MAVIPWVSLYTMSRSCVRATVMWRVAALSRVGGARRPRHGRGLGHCAQGPGIRGFRMTNDRCWVRSVLTSGLVLFGLFPVVAGTVPAQERTHVVGQVQDSSTRNPLPGVRVTVVGTAVGVMTDASGRYALHVPAGRDSLSFARIGYKRVVLAVAPVLNVAMRAQAVERSEEHTSELQSHVNLVCR